MSGSFDVCLDEERQIIVVAICGALSLQEFDAMERQTHECGDRLRDPSRARVLLDARQMVNPSRQVRRRTVEAARDPDLFRMAIWGAPLPARAGSVFISILVGKDVVRVFKSEAQALEWLLLKD